MKIFTALVWREIFERRLLLLASAFLGLVPIVLPWLPGRPERYEPEEIRTATAIALLALFGGAGVLILGSAMVGRDLSEGRLGFYFSRPVSGWTLWWSRLAAALALVLASFFLMAAPSAVLDPGEWTGIFFAASTDGAWPLLAFDQIFPSRYFGLSLPDPLPPAARAALGAAALLMLLALIHAASTLVRARSVWVLADLAGLAAVAALAWSARDRLVTEQALGALVWVERLSVPAVLGALLLAGGVQLARGRTDLGVGHRFLSATLWPALIVAALALGGYARWVTGGGVEDLGTVAMAEASPTEEWLAVGGRMERRAGTASAFLVDARSGEARRLGGLAVAGATMTFSGDGGTAIWMRCERFKPIACRVWEQDLRDAASPPRRTAVELDAYPTQTALSADGSRLAVASRRRIAVYELGSGRLLTAIAARHPEDVAFRSPDLLRFHEPFELEDGDFVHRIRQLDLATRQETETGRLPRGVVITRSPADDVMLYHRWFPVGLGLYHGETGELLAAVDSGWNRPGGGRFLADGRLVASVQDADGLALRVLSPAGEELQRIERHGVQVMGFGGEVSPGRALLAVLGEVASPGATAPGDPGIEPWPGRATWVLDADTGELEPLAVGVVPLGAPRGMPRQRLFLGAAGAVLRLDLATGERRTVIEPSGAPFPQLATRPGSPF